MTAISEKAAHLESPPDTTDTTNMSYRESFSRVPSIDTSSVSTVEEIHYPRVNVPVAFSLLSVVTILLYFTAENLVDSLEAMTTANPNTISKEFLSLIILPILSNAAEHSTAVMVAFKGKFDLVLGVAVGSCIQISLFVIPLLVLVAWGMGKPLSLLFDPMETVVSTFADERVTHRG
jgi:Ca2+:H+ antiporter